MRKRKEIAAIFLICMMIGVFTTTGCGACYSCGNSCGNGCNSACAGCWKGCEGCASCVNAVGCVDFCSGCSDSCWE